MTSVKPQDWKSLLRSLGSESSASPDTCANTWRHSILGPVPVAGLVELIHQCAKHRDAIDADPALTKLLTDLPWIPCQDGRRRPPGQVYFSSALINEVLGTSAPLVHAKIQPRTASADLLRRLGVSDIPRPADVVAHVKQIVTTAPSEQRIAQVVAVLRYLSRRAGELDHAFAPLRTLPWLPAEGENMWFAPNQLYLVRTRALFATTGRFLALRRTDQDQLRTTLSALGVRSNPPLELVADHVLNLTAAGKAPGNDVLRWLNDHASDPQIERLAACAFLPTADGRLERPDRVFRRRHRLIPWRASLRPGLDRFVDLLDALQVGTEPDATAAADVLTEISDTLDVRQELDAATLAVVNRCWEIAHRRVRCGSCAAQWAQRRAGRGRPALPRRRGSARGPARYRALALRSGSRPACSAGRPSAGIRAIRRQAALSGASWPGACLLRSDRRPLDRGSPARALGSTGADHIRRGRLLAAG